MNEEEQEQQAMQQDYLEAISILRNIREAPSDAGVAIKARLATIVKDVSKE